MSRFTTDLINGIEPYIPGEQPRDKRYIKLNTNENPFYTSPSAMAKISESALQNLNRYSDPECTELTKSIADYYGMETANVLVTNGSDEALAFAFYAYCKNGVCFPDVTYGFYEVIANLFGCPMERIVLQNDFTVNCENYYNKGKTVVLANPNAQTGIELSLSKIEQIIKNNRNNIVIIDQAYADFGSSNAISLINKYDNIVVINTFSKSRSLAGARVGYVIANENLICDLKKVKNSFHPYNVNSLSSALAAEAIRDESYFKRSVQCVKDGRAQLSKGLLELGFRVLPSSANFVLAEHYVMRGEVLYKKLKMHGILVRHFKDERISNFIRITIGTESEIAELLKVINEIIAEKDNENC
ncbi:MAG: histidinol-phosphate transaminase [Clostridia bacterium]|nr:histidinol-phosphate transaminase [Clostridia bacterium]